MLLAIPFLHRHFSTAYRESRSLIPYQRIESSSSPHCLQQHQPKLGTSRPIAKNITRLLLAVALATLAWKLWISGKGERNWSSGPKLLETSPEVDRDPGLLNNCGLSFLSRLLAIWFQMTFTLVLSCTELLVNTTRDKQTWRKICKHLSNAEE